MVDPAIFRLMVPNIVPDNLLVPTYRRGKISPRPEVLPHIVLLPAQIRPGYVDRTLPLDIPLSSAKIQNPSPLTTWPP